MRDEYFAADTVAFIDSDPMYTQASVPDYLASVADDAAAARIEMLREHDVFFTFGENIGAPDCAMPTGIFDWRPTRQPIVLDCFAHDLVPVADRRAVLTTVGSWKPTEAGPRVNGVQYHGKHTEFEKFITLPQRSGALAMELALSGEYPEQQLRANGWEVIDAYSVSSDPWVYRDYLARSAGEWSVAKQAYVASRSGWFSCRSACYLALGVPVIVQDTGFGGALPIGEGILTFTTLDEAAAAIERVQADPQRHSDAARAIAAEYFDARHVLRQLLEEAFTDARHV